MAAIELIVGLGNPGAEYDQTRHNAGALFVGQLARRHFGALKLENKFHGLTSRITCNGRDVRLLIPVTYMNRSGQAVAAMAGFFQIAPESILIAHDELDLPPGSARLKQGGGHGGHNGLRDIISQLGNRNDFRRLRLGIGHPGHASQVTGYVLGRAPHGEQELMDQAIDHSLDVIPEIVSGDWAAAMNRLHSHKN